MTTTMTTTTTPTTHTVEYLDGAAGWSPTNLGRFDTATEARTAAGQWAAGYARANDSARPPTRVVATASTTDTTR